MDLFELATKITSTGGEQLIATLNAIDAKGQAASGTMGKFGQILSTIATALGTAAVVHFFDDAIAESAAAQAGMERYRQSVRNAGGDLKAIEPQARAAAEALQATTRFSNTDAISALDLLTTITGNATTALGALQVASNLAASRQMDLVSAARLVGLVIDGHTALLARYGIVLNGTGSAFDQLAAKMQGVATVDGATVQGALQRQVNIYSDLKKAIGEAITSSSWYADAVKQTTQGLEDLTAWVKANADTIRVLTSAVAGLVEIVGGLLMATLRGWLEIWGLLQIAVGALVVAVEGIPDTLRLAFGEGLVLFTGFALQAAAILDKVFGSNLSASLTSGMVGRINAAGHAMVNAAQSHLNALTEGFKATATQVMVDAQATAGAPGKSPKPPHIPVAPESDADYQARLADYTKSFQTYLKALEEGVNYEGTRAESLQVLVEFQSELAARLKDTNIPLAEHVRLEKQLADVQGAIAAGSAAATAKSKADDQKRFETGLGAGLAGGLTKGLPATIAAIGNYFQTVKIAMSAAALDALAGVNAAFAEAPAELTSTLADSLSAAVTGGLGKGGEALLKGLGGIMSQMGKALITFGLAMIHLLPTLSNPFTSGPAALVAGGLLLALGSLLGSAATGGATSGGSLSTPGNGPGSAGNEIHVIIDPTGQAQVVSGPTQGGTILPSIGAPSTGGGASTMPRQPINFYVIGAADPQAQSQIGRIVEAAVRRGFIPSLARA